MEENKHSIIVRTEDLEALKKEIVLWGEAPWWPKNSLMRFERLSTEGAIVLGTRYRQRVLLPFAPSWHVEVTRMTETSITRRFLNGMFSGEETVSAHPQDNGIEVRYKMCYAVRGLLNNFFWKMIFRKWHDDNIKAILSNLKDYLEKGKK